MKHTQIVNLHQARVDPSAAQTQKRELNRVTQTIGSEIVDYCLLKVGRTIPITWLQESVVTRIRTKYAQVVQPSSVDRVLRQLRSKGAVLYTVVNRRKSLYRIDAVHRDKLEC